MARYNIGDRARTCTPPKHECQRKIVKVDGRRDKLVVCVENCCRSRHYKGSALASAGASIDSRKFLSDAEYDRVIEESRIVGGVFGIGIRFTLETGCRCGETLKIRKRHLDFRNGRMSIVRIPTLKKPGHPELPVHLDNSSGSQIVQDLRKWSLKMKPNEFLFQMGKRTFQKVFEKILDKVKPDRSSLVHIMRHTRASRLVRSGLDPNSIRVEMRWSSIELLKVYSHTTEDKIASAFEKLR
jgi:integrase